MASWKSTTIAPWFEKGCPSACPVYPLDVAFGVWSTFIMRERTGGFESPKTWEVTSNMEDYLKVIFDLEKSKKIVRVKDIANELNVTDGIVTFIADGTIKLSDLYTLKEGETAYSYQERRLGQVEEERIKVKEVKDGGYCKFYDTASGCTIYDSRPLQCRIQKCWDADSPSSGTNESILTRLDIPGIEDELLELISIHNQKCPAEKISRYCTELITGEKKHLEQLLEILSYDYRIRQITLKRLYESNELDLFFGRSAERIIQHFGFNIEKDAEGNFVFLNMTVS